MVLLLILSFDPNDKSDEKRNQGAQKLQPLRSDLGRAAAERVCLNPPPGRVERTTADRQPRRVALDENVAFVQSQLESYHCGAVEFAGALQEITARYCGSERDLEDKLREIAGTQTGAHEVEQRPAAAFISPASSS